MKLTATAKHTIPLKPDFTQKLCRFDVWMLVLRSDQEHLEFVVLHPSTTISGESHARTLHLAWHCRARCLLIYNIYKRYENDDCTTLSITQTPQTSNTIDSGTLPRCLLNHSKSRNEDNLSDRPSVPGLYHSSSSSCPRDSRCRHLAT